MKKILLIYLFVRNLSNLLNKLVKKCHNCNYHNQVNDLNTSNIFYPDYNHRNFQDSYPHKNSNKYNMVTKIYC